MGRTKKKQSQPYQVTIKTTQWVGLVDNLPEWPSPETGQQRESEPTRCGVLENLIREVLWHATEPARGAVWTYVSGRYS